MPNWKKLIVSGSDASLNSLNVTNNVTAQSFTGSFSGSFTAPGATTQVVYNNGGVLSANSGFVYSGSYVGIGTTTPSLKFNVEDTGATYVAQFKGGNSTYIVSGDTSLPGESGFNARNSVAQLFLGVGPNAEAYFSGTSGATALGLYLGGTNALYVNSSRNVGIGTTSPATKLDLVGSYKQTQASGGVGLYHITTPNADQVRGVWDLYTDTAVTPDFFGRFGFKFEGGANNAFRQFQVHVGDATTPKLIVNGSGNVGIGTISPTVKLDVSGSINIRTAAPTITFDRNGSYTWRLVNGDGGTYPLSTFNIANNAGTASATFLDNGNVGIGTTSPSQKLHLYGSGNQLLFIENSSTYHLYAGISSNVGIVGSSNATPLSLQTNGVSRLYIDTTGNVGIGTTSPAYKFQVVGGDIAIDFNRYLRGGSGGDWNLVNLYNGATGDIEITMLSTAWYLRHNANATFAGNVGIGTTNPGYKLDVNGNSKFVAGFFSYTTDGLFNANARPGIYVSTPGGARGTYIGYRDFGSGEYWGRIGVSGSVAWSLGIGNSTGTNFSIGLNNDTATDYFTIVSGSGNVGIGTTTPTTTLEVNGNVKATSFTGSFSGSITHAVSASYALSSSYALTSSYAVSASYAITASHALTASYINPLNQDLILTGSFIATGGVTASNALINGNLTVIGTASFNYTTASIVNVGAATITLNTDNPAVRFGGINVIDSGSFGTSSTGSLLWDSQKNRWIYSNPSGSTYDGGLLISGPRNTTGLGNEEGTTFNAILKGQGGDHLTSSGMFEDSSGNVGVGTASPSAKLEVNGNVKATSFTGSFSGSVTAPGSTTQIVYNDNGVLAASSGLVYSGSNVGIGISAPTDKLHIVSSATGNQFGRITATDSAASAAWVAQNDSGDNVVYRVFGSGVGGTQMGAALGRSASLLANLGGSGVFLLGTFSNTNFVLGTNNTENMRITTAGNVGIGTSSPLTRLDLRASSNSAITPLASVPDTATTLLIGNTGTNGVLALGHDNAGHPWLQGRSVLANQAAEDILINPLGGNVGIGITSPEAKLDVSGSIKIIYPTGKLYTAATPSFYGEITPFNSSGQMIFNVSYPEGNIIFQSGSVEVARFKDAKLGIGTASPAEKLHVSGDSVGITIDGTTASRTYYNRAGSYIWSTGLRAGDTKFHIYDERSADRFVIDDSGNVGIGTTSPSYKLQVNGDGNGLYVIGANSSPYTQTIATFVYGGNSNSINIENQGGKASLQARDGSNNAMNLHLNPVGGNVGIGTAGPSYKLEVVGAVSASTYYGDGSNLTGIGSGSVSAAGSDGQLQYNNSGLFGGASRLYYNDSTNRVGIGTSSPGYDLDVSGSVRVQDRLRVGPVNSGNGVIHQSSDATINPTSATVVWTVSGTAGICAFIEYYLLNSNTGTSQRAGNIVTTWNAAGTPQITHTETSTPDVGSTTPVTFSTTLTLGGDPQLIATNSGGDSWYMIMNYRYF